MQIWVKKLLLFCEASCYKKASCLREAFLKGRLGVNEKVHLKLKYNCRYFLN